MSLAILRGGLDVWITQRISKEHLIANALPSLDTKAARVFRPHTVRLNSSPSERSVPQNDSTHPGVDFSLHNGLLTGALVYRAHGLDAEVRIWGPPPLPPATTWMIKSAFHLALGHECVGFS